MLFNLLVPLLVVSNGMAGAPSAAEALGLQELAPRRHRSPDVTQCVFAHLPRLAKNIVFGGSPPGPKPPDGQVHFKWICLFQGVMSNEHLEIMQKAATC